MGSCFSLVRPGQALSTWQYSYIVVPGFKVPRKKKLASDVKLGNLWNVAEECQSKASDLTQVEL